MFLNVPHSLFSSYYCFLKTSLPNMFLCATKISDPAAVHLFVVVSPAEQSLSVRV